eukprot:8682189-Pyramimonas_sp.AAC.1
MQQIGNMIGLCTSYTRRSRSCPIVMHRTRNKFVIFSPTVHCRERWRKVKTRPAAKSSAQS